MFGQFFIKEWKEKRVFIILAVFLFLALIVIRLSGREETVGIPASALLMFILPLIAIMIGASSFTVEFKNDAWAYLFSRPVKRWAV